MEKELLFKEFVSPFNNLPIIGLPTLGHIKFYQVGILVEKDKGNDVEIEGWNIPSEEYGIKILPGLFKGKNDPRIEQEIEKLQ